MDELEDGIRQADARTDALVVYLTDKLMDEIVEALDGQR